MTGGPLGRLADDDRALWGERLQPRRGVDDVASRALLDHRALPEGDERLTVCTAMRTGGLPPDTRSRMARAAPRALRVVLVCDRGTEHAHRGVADELVQRAAEPLDLFLGDRMERHEDPPDVLRISAVAALGESGEVGEHDRDEPAFLEQGAGSGGFDKRGPAGRAEAGVRRHLGAAGRAERPGRCRTTHRTAPRRR